MATKTGKRAPAPATPAALAPPPGMPPYTGDSSGAVPASFAADAGDTFRNIGSSGLKQFGGYVREEFLPFLNGPRGMAVYREMGDNSPIVAGLLFAIRAVMRKVQWRVEPADDSPRAQEARDFYESCMHDMSDTWEHFINEALSMLQYGYSPHEINYKRRLGPQLDEARAVASGEQKKVGSRFDDGKIGWRSLPLRGQDTIQKWYFDEESRILGLQQIPWQGSMIDIPIEKLMLFRPSSYKGNPEGRAIIRPAYRPWYFTKRLEEQEAILFERMGGIPVIRVPGSIISQAKAGQADAIAALETYKKIGKATRIDEQMYVLIPSDMHPGPNGPSSQPLYDFKLETPQSGSRSTTADTTITRHNNTILMSVMADFLTLGHEARGTQSLAVSKIDLFLQACEGFLDGIASVINRHGLPRLCYLNADDIDMLPTFEPDMASQLDPAGLGQLLLQCSQAGMPLFPDPNLENWVRDNMGMPALPEEDPDTPRPPPFMPLPGTSGGPPGHTDADVPMPKPGTPEHAALMQQVKLFQKAARELGAERMRKRSAARKR